MTETLPPEKGDLLPCPFCGSEQVTTAPGALSRWFVICKACGATANSDEGEAETITAWNTRIPPADRNAVLEEAAREFLRRADYSRRIHSSAEAIWVAASAYLQSLKSPAPVADDGEAGR